MDTKTKRQQEQQTIYTMIQLYCRKNHHHKECLCEECQELYDYACKRIDLCPFMETKTFCSNCKVHCYTKEKQEAVRRVMRFSGPRMLFHKPGMALRHLYLSRKENK